MKFCVYSPIVCTTIDDVLLMADRPDCVRGDLHVIGTSRTLEQLLYEGNKQLSEPNRLKPLSNFVFNTWTHVLMMELPVVEPN